MGCPDDDTLALLLGGEAADDTLLHAHIDRCPRCAAVLVELATLYHEPDLQDEGPGVPAPGDTIAGRYRLERALGRGGMGVVYLATDVELRRDVAIKWVRPDVVHDRQGDELQVRLRREARAMARINDAAVVPVLDVGRARGMVYVVMERVEGTTLRAWLRARTRSPATILEALVVAARGLLAAHRAGVIHRDFKPDNVLVGHDGRVRVTDFGMASLHGQTQRTPASHETSRLDSESALEEVRTQTGMVIGTPAYMAPEQLDGHGIDARSDQYAWCVVLTEALTGERPFTGATPAALREAQRHAAGRAVDRLPSRVRGVVLRGLREDPAERWSGLDEALRVLQGPTVARWPWAVALALGCGSWWLAPSAPSAPADRARCEAGVAAVASVWSRAWAQAEQDPTWVGTRAQQDLRSELERYVLALEDGYGRSCEAEPRGFAVDPGVVLDCLDRRLAHIDPILERWAAHPGVDLLDVVAELQAPQACFDPQEARPLPFAPLRAEQARRLRVALESGLAHLSLGDNHEARRRLDALQVEVDALGFAPIRAEWSLMYGRVLLRQGHEQLALERLEAAYWDANEAGDDWIAARSAVALFKLHGETHGRFEESDRWARHAESALERADDAVAWYHFHAGQAGVAIRRVDPGAAREHAERALALATRLWPAGHHDEVTARANLAMVDILQGNLAAAEVGLRRAIDDRERRYGAAHPDLASMLHVLAEAVSRQGRSDEAEAMLVRALAIIVDAHGPEHPLASDIRNGLAIVAAMRGDHGRAEQLFRENLEQVESRWGASHERVMPLLTNLGNLEILQGKLDEARRDLERAMALEEAAVGPAGVGLVPKLILLSQVERGAGRPREAAVHLERALEILASRDDTEPDLIAATLEHRGGLRREQGQLEDASVDLHRALSLRRDDASRVPTLLELGHLARAQGQPERAAAHYRTALAVAEPDTHDATRAHEALARLSSAD